MYKRQNNFCFYNFQLIPFKIYLVQIYILLHNTVDKNTKYKIYNWIKNKCFKGMANINYIIGSDNKQKYGYIV